MCGETDSESEIQSCGRLVITFKNACLLTVGLEQLGSKTYEKKSLKFKCLRNSVLRATQKCSLRKRQKFKLSFGICSQEINLMKSSDIRCVVYSDNHFTQLSDTIRNLMKREAAKFRVGKFPYLRAVFFIFW